jgi:hypothetical protein
LIVGWIYSRFLLLAIVVFYKVAACAELVNTDSLVNTVSWGQVPTNPCHNNLPTHQHKSFFCLFLCVCVFLFKDTLRNTYCSYFSIELRRHQHSSSCLNEVHLVPVFSPWGPSQPPALENSRQPFHSLLGRHFK